MFVGTRMTKDPITVSPEDTLGRAGDLLKRNRIHHLPVAVEGTLVGIVTGSDLRNFALEKTTVNVDGEVVVAERTVGEIMTRDVVTANPQDTLEDALLLLHRRRFGALPVVEGRRLVGIITKADILAALIDTLRIEEIGVRVQVVLPQSIPALAKLVATLGAMDLEVKSLVLTPRRGNFVAFIRIATIDVTGVRRALSEAGFSVPELEDFLG
ncbi:MAG: acetoin utilization AcuB family protein [Deltaproteobacteria bacterium]